MATFEHPHIKLIRPQSPADFPFSNSIFIDDEVSYLIDLGSGASVYRPLAERVDTVLLTHYHYDHIHAWPMFNHGCIMVGEEEQAIFQDEDMFFSSNGYFRWPEIMGANKDYNWERGRSKAAGNPEILAEFGFPGINIHSCYRDGQVFDSGHVKFQAVHLPGHTPGHYGFYFPEEGLLFSADYDLAPFGPWYGGEYCHYKDLLDSMQRIIALAPRLLFGSHRRKVFDDVPAQLEQYMTVPRQREAAALAALERQPMDFQRLCAVKGALLAPDDDPHEVFWDRMMLLKQLDHLVDEGILQRDADGLYRKIR